MIQQMGEGNSHQNKVLPGMHDYIRAGRAEIKATAIVRGGRLANVASEEIYPADLAVYEDRIVALGDVNTYEDKATKIVDASGYYLCPGLIDGHLTPQDQTS